MHDRREQLQTGFFGGQLSCDPSRQVNKHKHCSLWKASKTLTLTSEFNMGIFSLSHICSLSTGPKITCQQRFNKSFCRLTSVACSVVRLEHLLLPQLKWKHYLHQLGHLENEKRTFFVFSFLIQKTRFSFTDHKLLDLTFCQRIGCYYYLYYMWC